MDEGELIRRARRGDQGAFRALVETHQAMVYRLAYRLTGSPEDAADLTQEVFLRLWRGLEGFQGRSALSTWLYRLTSNAAVDLLRREGRRSALPLETGEGEALQIPDPGPTPEGALERQEEREAVRRGLAALSPDHRQVLLLRELEGLSYREIARELGLEEGTVKSRIARARLALRAELLRDGNFFAGPPSK